jgi:hypothetical protein
LARKIWSNPGKPPDANVAKALKVEGWQLREALHKIKRACGLTSTDDVDIWDDGTVTDHITDDFCGVIHDEI